MEPNDVLNLQDPFVRRIAQFAVLALAIFLAIPAAISALIALDYLVRPEQTGNPTLVRAFSFFPNPEGEHVKELLSILELFIAALPAILIAVAVEKKNGDGRQELNRLGRVLILLFGIGLVFAIFAYLTIDTERWGSNHRLEVGGLRRVVALARVSLQASAFYLALLFGLRAIK